MLIVKNWTKFQHYKDRCPPWIKLATDTFQNYEFSKLADCSKLLAICIWTLAARSKDGSVADDFEYIKGMGRLGDAVKQKHLDELISKGFLERSDLLADREQSACSEGEGETEERQRESGESVTGSLEDPLLTFPCSGDGPKTWDLVPSAVEAWTDTWPGVDVLQEAKKALAWINARPTRRKTHRGMPAFLTGWLGRAQDKGGAGANGSRTGAAFAAILRGTGT